MVLKVGREGIKSIPSLSKAVLQNAKNISATPVGQAVVKTTGSSVLVDSSLQAKDMYKCKCLQWDGSRSLVAVGTGAAFWSLGGRWHKQLKFHLLVQRVCLQPLLEKILVD